MTNANTGSMPANHGRQSLAQLRGLAAPPVKKLTEEQWVGIEMEALTRGDVTGVCAICHEDLIVERGGAGQDQVILSCSHTFHSACIQSFERFLRARERTCPICRHSSYQKKVTTVGSMMKRLDCARLMQRTVRGWLTKKDFKVHLRRFYNGGGGDAARRRNFYANEIGDLGNRALEEVEMKEDSIDKLFAQFDQSLALSRQVFQEGGAGGGSQGSSTLTSEVHATAAAKRPTTMSEWLAVWETAKARGVTECPICMGDCSFGQEGGTAPSNVSLLSCSHIFHTKCLEAFENFNIYEVCLCPVCRSSYEKVDVSRVINLECGDSRWM